ISRGRRGMLPWHCRGTARNSTECPMLRSRQTGAVERSAALQGTRGRRSPKRAGLDWRTSEEHAAFGPSAEPVPLRRRRCHKKSLSMATPAAAIQTGDRLPSRPPEFQARSQPHKERTKATTQSGSNVTAPEGSAEIDHPAGANVVSEVQRRSVLACREVHIREPAPH